MPEVKPYTFSPDSKKQQVEQMFDTISDNYDFLNHILSLQIDKSWRNKVVELVKKQNPKKILDVATGTADLALAMAKKCNAEIVGYDISQKMLDVGIRKVKKNNLTEKITFIKGDAENINFNDNVFDVVTVAFGVRNFENIEAGLLEMKRVLKTQGKLIILEFSKPEGLLAPLFIFYFKNILPYIGKIFSKDARAYTYLPNSVNAFPSGINFKKILEKTGFKEVKYKKLTFGVSTIYEGLK